MNIITYVLKVVNLRLHIESTKKEYNQYIKGDFMKRRDFLLYTLAGTGVAFGLNSCGDSDNKEIKVGESIRASGDLNNLSNPLPIPPLADIHYKNGVKEFSLNLQHGEKNFLEGLTTKTFGVNGDFLGPTIKVHRDDNIAINVTNSLNEATTLHWHGLHVDGKNDGGPHQVMKEGESWKAEFTIDQRASTAWYHPHMMDRTGYQVYMGIAGLFIIDDENSESLPNEYGIDDIPLVLQDRRFNRDGSFSYVETMHDRMMGLSGNFLFVNGSLRPNFKAKKKLTRVRLLNGSNSRIYTLGFENGKIFSLVATDGGFLETPIQLQQLLLSPGERAEILIELEEKEKISLVDFISKSYLMHIEADNKLLPSKEISKKISAPFSIQRSHNENTRMFNLEMGRGMALINGKRMEMNRIDEEVPKGLSEIWRITNIGNMMRMPHPFHIHGCSFEVLSRNNQAPYAFERGLKDTVLVGDGEVVDVRVIFKKEADINTPYMYHCHNLEHEDMGMMGQFIVT